MDLGKAPGQGTLALIIVTATIAAVATLVIQRLAPWLARQLARPFVSLANKIWGWIAPRNPWSISLRSYRKHVRRSPKLSMIENPVGPVPVLPLEQAFAPLRLHARDQQEAVNLFEYAASEPRIILLGGPGTGKTTLMKHFVVSIIERECHPSLNDKIPVFVVLRDLASRNQSVEAAIVDALAAHHFPGADNLVQSALRHGRLVVVLDGLDEVGASRGFVVQQIQRFCELDDQREHKNHLLVTCRENSYRTEDLRMVLPNVLRVEPFTNHHMRLFLKGWPEHKGRVALKIYSELQGVPEIRDACRNPLLLSILVGLYLESESFEIPRSRDRFYMAAIDELLVSRPARRQMTQSFSREDKLDVLQRVALEHLESIVLGEDTEALSREAILRCAKDVLQRDFDGNRFLDELVHVNGIIKPTEGSRYTCSHRTIQEYQAAREARRQRSVEAILERFAARPDLFEVLLFYCGVIDNIPQMRRIVEYFTERSAWPQAGECLLNIREALPAEVLDPVTAGLYQRISAEKPILTTEMRTVEILSALGQRRQAEFDSARKHFSKTIELLTGQTESGASALEAVLASSPETAQRLVPGLLDHPDPVWQRAAVRLLRDAGSDEGLDDLLGLLQHKAGPVRSEAGRVLADLLKTRGDDLRQRAALVPDRRDRTVWPLEAHVPARLALAIIEAVVETGETRNQAIDCGVRALLAVKLRSRDEQRFLRQWRRLPRDVSLNRYRARLGVFLPPATWMLLAAATVGMVATGAWGLWSGSVVFVSRDFAVRILDATPMRQVRDAATAVVAEIERVYPPNASGLARILPWNWTVEPLLPEEAMGAFKLVRAIAHGDSWANREALDRDSLASLLRLRIRGEVVAELAAALKRLPPGQPEYLMAMPSAVPKTILAWVGTLAALAASTVPFLVWPLNQPGLRGFASVSVTREVRRGLQTTLILAPLFPVMFLVLNERLLMVWFWAMSLSASLLFVTPLLSVAMSGFAVFAVGWATARWCARSIGRSIP